VKDSKTQEFVNVNEVSRKWGEVGEFAKTFPIKILARLDSASSFLHQLRGALTMGPSNGYRSGKTLNCFGKIWPP